MIWSSSRIFEIILALRGKYMAHNHGYVYQIRIVHQDGTEELSGLMNNTEQVAQAMAAANRPQGKAYWLLTRNALCPNCLDREQIIVECPVTNIPSPRYDPNDSHYLLSMGLKDRYALGFSPSLHTP
jgi:hypothetical protein